MKIDRDPWRPAAKELQPACYNEELRKSAIFSMPKVGFVSLGCPKNLVDSEVMMGVLARDGYELTPRADEADVLVVNTCSFIEPAQKESVDAILEMAEHKKFGAAKKLIVAGCLVERYRDQILSQIPEVDAVVGTGEVERILEAVRRAYSPRQSTPPTSRLPKAATIPARSASFRSCAANFAAGGSNRWFAKRKSSRPTEPAKSL